MSSLDLDTASEETNKHTSTLSSSDIIPQSLRLSRQTVTGLVSQPQHAARFRLDALADAFLGPLQQLLGKKRYMLSEDHPSSLDCVALAYLALAGTPQMPHAWLAEAMKSRYPTLCMYVSMMTEETFGGPVDLSHAFLSSQDELNQRHADKKNTKRLPWRRPERKGFTAAGSALLSGSLDALPLAEYFQNCRIRYKTEAAEGRDPSTTSDTSTKISNIFPPLLAVASTVAAIAAYLFYSGREFRPALEKSSLSDMGEAGAMLDMVALGGYSNPSHERTQRTGRVPVGLEVDVEVDETSMQ